MPWAEVQCTLTGNELHPAKTHCVAASKHVAPPNWQVTLVAKIKNEKKKQKTKHSNLCHSSHYNVTMFICWASYCIDLCHSCWWSVIDTCCCRHFCSSIFFPPQHKVALLSRSPWQQLPPRAPFWLLACRRQQPDICINNLTVARVLWQPRGVIDHQDPSLTRMWSNLVNNSVCCRLHCKPSSFHSRIRADEKYVFFL